MKKLLPLLLLVVIGAACGSSPTAATTATADAPTSTTSAPLTSTPTTPDATTTTTTALPVGVLGEDWEVIDSDLNPRAAAVHGDTLFVISDDNAGIRVLSSQDGEVWTQEADLNALSETGIGDVLFAGLVSDGSAMYGYLATEPADGVSSDGANLDLYILDNTTGAWSVRGPGATGLDQRLEGAERFRFYERGGHGIVAGDGQVTIALAGQWWVPYETSAFDFSTVWTVDEDTWSTYAENRSRVDPSTGWFMIDGFARSDSGILVAISDKVSDGPLGTLLGEAVRISTDGATWDRGLLPAGDDIAMLDIRGLVFGGGSFVAVGVQAPATNATEDRILTSWVSTDGQTWTLGELPMPTETGPNGVDLKTIAWTGETYVALGFDDQSSGWMWRSSNGTDWELIPIITGIVDDSGAFPINRTKQLIGWNGGVVSFAPGYTSFSPPRR